MFYSNLSAGLATFGLPIANDSKVIPTLLVKPSVLGVRKFLMGSGASRVTVQPVTFGAAGLYLEPPVRKTDCLVLAACLFVHHNREDSAMTPGRRNREATERQQQRSDSVSDGQQMAAL